MTVLRLSQSQASKLSKTTVAMMLLGILLALGLVQGSQGNALAYANRWPCFGLKGGQTMSRKLGPTDPWAKGWNL